MKQERYFVTVSLAVEVDLAWLSINTQHKLLKDDKLKLHTGGACTQRGIAPEKKAAGPSLLSILVLGHHAFESR